MLFRSTSRTMSTKWFLLSRKVIVHSGASSNDVAATTGHSIRDIATSYVNFFLRTGLCRVC